MDFSRLGRVFEEIESVSGRLEITAILSKIFNDLDAQEAQIVSYLSLGTLLPPYKNIQFHIAKKGIIEIIATLLDMSSAEITQENNSLGDLGTVIATHFKGIDQGLSIQQVYDQLVSIAMISGTGSTEKKSEKLVELLQQVDAFSAKYIVRIITKTLRLGFSDMTLIDAFSWMEVGNKSIRGKIEHAYNICADLGLVAKTLKNGGIEAVEAMKSHVGIPIRPAAAERLPDSKAVMEKLGPCLAQPKLDGFRLQIHLDRTGPEPIVKFYSRNLLDMSEMFPEVVKALINLPVKNLICEGEAIGYSPETDSFLTFQETVKRKRKHGIDQATHDTPLRVYLFDLLYVNNESMLNKDHTHRRNQLEYITKKIDNDLVFLIDEGLMTTDAQLEHCFLETIGAGLEGLVVKKPDAIYQPGKRNFNWIKLKRKTGQKLGDTVDAVVLGYYFGQGRRTKLGIGAFLVGVYNKATDSFESIAKVGTGLTDLEWINFKMQCDNIVVDQKPDNVLVSKNLFCDVWVDPVLVCVIRADDITKSPMHKAGKVDNDFGYALRFPRFIGFRQDKSATDITASCELPQLYLNQF